MSGNWNTNVNSKASSPTSVTTARVELTQSFRKGFDVCRMSLRPLLPRVAVAILTALVRNQPSTAALPSRSPDTAYGELLGLKHPIEI